MVTVDISLTVVADIKVVEMICVWITVTRVVWIWVAVGRMVWVTVTVTSSLKINVVVGAIRSLVGRAEEIIGMAGIGGTINEMIGMIVLVGMGTTLSMTEDTIGIEEMVDEITGIIMLVGTGTTLSRTEEMIGIIVLVGSGSKTVSDAVGGSNGTNVKEIGVLIGTGRIPRSGTIPEGIKDESIGPLTAVGVM